MKCRKIAIIAPFGPQTGGMVELAKVLSTMFEEAGHRVTRVNKSRRGFAPVFAGRLFFAVLRAALNSDCLTVISGSGKSLSLIDLPAVLLGKLLGKKTVIDFVGGMAMEEAKNWPFHKKFALRSATVVVVPTGKMLASFIDQGIRARYEVIPHTADVELFRKAGEKKHPSGKRVLLSAKNFESYANIDHLIKCASMISGEVPGTELWVAGGGPEERRLKKTADEVFPGGVVFLGKVNHQKMAEVMAEADVLVHATRYESFGIVLAEAMAAGKPVVAYDAGGISDVIENGRTGFLLEYGDIEGMKEKVVELLKNGNIYESMSRNGSAAAEKYTKRSILKGWERLFGRLWN